MEYYSNKQELNNETYKPTCTDLKTHYTTENKKNTISMWFYSKANIVNPIVADTLSNC